MTTIPILAALVPCAGIGCGRHQCPNYLAMEGSDPSELRIATCHGLDTHRLAPRIAPKAGEGAL